LALSSAQKGISLTQKEIKENHRLSPAQKGLIFTPEKG